MVLPPPADRESCVFVVFVLAAMTTLPPLSATFGQRRDAGCDVDERLGLEVSSGLLRYQCSALVIDGRDCLQPGVTCGFLGMNASNSAELLISREITIIILCSELVADI